MEEKLPKREIVYYYLDFYDRQNKSVKKKLDWTLKLIAEIDYIPEKYFIHLIGSKGLYEIKSRGGFGYFSRVFFF